MSSTPYVLIAPVTVTVTRPGNDRVPEKTETLTVDTIQRRSIGGALYFATGDVSYVNASAEGSVSVVELDDRIDAYLSHQFVDPKDPDSAAVFEALTMPDAWAAREDVIAEFRAATAAARLARLDAPADRLKLIVPFDLHGETVREIKLKEPKHRDFRRFGSPWTWSRLAGGEVSSVERIDIVAKYLEGCIDHDAGRDVIGFMKLPDLIQLKMAVVAFFTRAAEVAAGARKSTPSSSDAAP